ncbi:MAG: class II aldolase/adducin family protein [Gammaproteobacteria bacterium]|nr:class II aldolase/adducin family protein [Gammaproteobacteria bacterium]
MESPQFNDLPARDQIAEICRHIYQAGLTTTSGGNLSLLDKDGTIWVSPAAVDKGRLRGEDVVGLYPDGSVRGSRNPSSEVPFHRAIYRARPELRAIIHAHPPALVAFSIARRRPDLAILPETRAVCGRVGFAPYALPGSKELGTGIAAEFEKGHDAVIMENHGAVVGGRDLLNAFERFEALEFAARIEAAAASVGTPVMAQTGPNDRPSSDTWDASQEAAKKPRANSCEHEREILVRLLKRAYQQGLTSSLACSMSLRCNNGFLLNPDSIPCWQVASRDILQLDLDRQENEIAARGHGTIHHAIYAHNPDIQCVVIAPPPHVMAFGVSDVTMNMRTIPESWILLQDIPAVDYGAPGQDLEAFARLFGPERPAVLVQHQALYVTGATPLQAFDRLEVAELSARALIMGQQLGGVSPMDKHQVEALRRRFLAPGSPGLTVSEA